MDPSHGSIDDRSLNVRLILATFRAPRKWQALKSGIKCRYKSNLHSLLRVMSVLVAFYAEMRA